MLFMVCRFVMEPCLSHECSFFGGIEPYFYVDIEF